MTATRNESSHWIFDILELVTMASTPPSAIEIADRLSLAITTAHRGLHTLEQSGYIAQHPMSSRYVLAGSTHRLAKALLARFAIRGASLHYMRYVTGQTQESTMLVAPLGWYSLTVATVAGPHDIGIPTPVGSTIELHRSCGGLAVLAFLPAARIDRYTAWTQKRKSGSARTIRSQLNDFRSKGYALLGADDLSPGELAVPIRNIGGDALASIVVRSGALSAKPGRTKVLAAAVAAARRIEGIIQIEPERFQNPYDHLPPDLIVLPVEPRRK